jgi:hypothetical protein
MLCLLRILCGVNIDIQRVCNVRMIRCTEFVKCRRERWEFNGVVHHRPSQSILAHETLQKATGLTEKHLSVHKEPHIKLNTSICLPFLYTVCKKSTANLKLIDNLIVLPDTWTTACCAD